MDNDTDANYTSRLSKLYWVIWILVTASTGIDICQNHNSVDRAKNSDLIFYGLLDKFMMKFNEDIEFNTFFSVYRVSVTFEKIMK